MNYKEQYDFWLQDDYFDEATKQELKDLSGNEAEIEERFYKNLELHHGFCPDRNFPVDGHEYHQRIGRVQDKRRGAPPI